MARSNKIKPHKNGSNSWGCVMAAAGETADWAIGINGVKQQKLQNLTKLNKTGIKYLETGEGVRKLMKFYL